MDKREIYKEKAEAKLDLLITRIDMLRAGAQDRAADAKLNLSGQIDVLNNKRMDLESRLRQIQSAGEEALDELGKGLELALEDVQHALDRAGEALEKVV
jgi:hypothetical protein